MESDNFVPTITDKRYEEDTSLPAAGHATCSM